MKVCKEKLTSLILFIPQKLGCDAVTLAPHTTYLTQTTKARKGKVQPSYSRYHLLPQPQIGFEDNLENMNKV